MVKKVELIPLSDGNRITVKTNEKVIIGRGSSLGCNEKKISRHHAELILKEDDTLWIKPTHANPVFYRPYNGKTTQLTKDIERELKDGDRIGLLPTSYFFRVSFSTDLNNNNDSDSDSLYTREKVEKVSPVHTTSADNWSPIHGYRRSISNEDISVFDFDEDVNIEPTRTICKRISYENKVSTDSEPKPSPPVPKTMPSINLTRISVPSPAADDQDEQDDQDEADTNGANDKSRKLPKWMAGAPTPSPVTKPTTTTPKSSYSRSSSVNASTSAKRHLSFEGDSNGEMNESSNMSDARSPATPGETKSPGKLLSRISSTKNFDSDSGDGFDSTTSKTPPPKKIKPGGKRRPICQFGASCYRKNPVHRAEHSHPGDSDHDDSKQFNDNEMNDDNDDDKPDCPFGKSCYRQNPQHKRDFKH